MLIEIIMSITGVVLLLFSVILTGNKNSKENDFFYGEKQIEELKAQADKALKDAMEETQEQAKAEMDSTLSRISNEKILEMNEFTDSVLAKIQENHEHVVFLYNMLNSKDDEVKDTLAEMETTKQDMKESLADVVKVAKQLSQVVKKKPENQPLTGIQAAALQRKVAPKEPQVKEQPKINPTINRPPVLAKVDYHTSAQTMVDEATGQMNLPEMMQNDNKNEEILKLYRSGKSVLDISKQLSLGQGEVKLVIDLYGAL